MEIISVLLCTYNEPLKYLKLSIESILSQTYTNIQLIIVNDNPKRADMADLLAAYAREDSRIKYIVNPSNIGLVSSLNAGLKDAIGEYIARMDADDIATKDRLEKQLEFLQVKSYDMVGCNAIKIDENGKEIGYLNVPTAHEKIKEYQLYGGCVLHPTWLGKREVFEKLNGYRLVYACEDFDFILRVIQNGFKIGNMPAYGLYYRIRTESVSSKANIRQKLTMYYLIDNGAYQNVPSVEMLEKYLNSVKYKDDFVRNIKKYKYYVAIPVIYILYSAVHTLIIVTSGKYAGLKPGFGIFEKEFLVFLSVIDRLVVTK